jgi:RNA polymerase-binding transcription factor DksA
VHALACDRAIESFLEQPEHAMEQRTRSTESPLSPEEIQAYHRLLLEEFAGHAREVEALETRALVPSGGARFQEDDESVEEAGLATDLVALDAEDRLGYEVHEALERIAAGTFGRCEDCGGRIGRARLDLVPYARSCTPCAQERELGLPR